MLNEENIRLIFGLKLRQLRQAKRITPKDLAKRAGISISYLNEIEKGKKYPKAEKIVALANVLQVDYDTMVSLKLDKKLAPIADLLKTNMISELPLDLFGISIEKLVDIVSNAPTRVSAFISTLITMARNYEMNVEQFYFTALRSYQEMNDNYFEELEDSVLDFAQTNEIDLTPPIRIRSLDRLLRVKYQYTINDKQLTKNTELQGVRSILFKREKRPILLLNGNLNAAQKTFQLGKELGYQQLKLKERNMGPSWIRTKSFEQILNNFKASYFAGALLINRDSLITDIKKLFRQQKWDEEGFLYLMKKYQVSPETFMHRLTNILPKFFGLSKLFFLRFSTDTGSEVYQITKELHFSHQHNPHANELHEHYCRRWLSINLLQSLAEKQKEGAFEGPLVRAQRSIYIDSGKEYFNISVSRAMYPTPDRNSSVTIGMLINRNLKNQVHFWNDPAVPVKLVNETCERCRLTDCQQRIAAPKVLNKRAEKQRLEAIVQRLTEEYE